METALFLLVDGVTNGAVYGLVALSLILVYTVTRVVNIAQGEYVTLGALSFSTILGGGFAPIVSLVVAGVVFFLLLDLFRGHTSSREKIGLVLRALATIAVVVAVSGLAWVSPGNYWLAAIAAVVSVSALGTVIYRATVEPVADAPAIILLIITVGVHMIMHGTTVLIWGPEPRSVPPIADGGVLLGSVYVTYQSLFICAVSVAAMVGLYLFSERTLIGQALQASAVNRVGAQLCGIPVRWAGQVSFGLAGAFSALSGLLLAPLVTANYDMGFVMGLKGFVAAALGGIVEYPMAIVGVLFVGVVESTSAYQFSAYREVVVFLLVIPILIWRNAVKPPRDH